MNEKFYSLPETKQQRIINAGFRAFSQNSYKKAPMREIADYAGISKSLLFHYFHNKRELYVFLWDYAADLIMEYLTEYKCYEPNDLFEMMERGMQAKFKLMEKHPDLSSFAIKAFYEKDMQIAEAIHQSYRKHFSCKAQNALAKLNPDDFIPGLNLNMMYREMYLASEGYLWEIIQQGDPIDSKILEKDFNQMISFWKSIYLRKES